MPRYEDDYRARGYPTTRRADDSVREDRHRIDRGEARERIRIIDDAYAERPVRSERLDRNRPERGERLDRGERMDYIEDPRIGVPRGDPRANTAVRREDRDRETITAYRDPRTGFLRDAKTHELIDVPSRPVTRPRGDDYDDDLVMERDELPRRRVPEREPVYYDRKARVSREDDDYTRGPPRSDYRMIEFFVDGADIEREVIQTDICHHLGNDATVRRYVQDGREGYMVRGYRALTTAQLEDLKQASAKYRRHKRNERNTGSYADMRYHKDQDAMDVEMDYDPLPPRDRYRGEPEPRLERADRHKLGALPVATTYVEPSYPAYTIGPSQGPYGAAQRPRNVGNYSPQGSRPGHAVYHSGSSGAFENRTPISMAPIPTTTQPFRDSRAGQYIPMDTSASSGFIPEPSRGVPRHGR